MTVSDGDWTPSYRGGHRRASGAFTMSTTMSTVRRLGAITVPPRFAAAAIVLMALPLLAAGLKAVSGPPPSETGPGIVVPLFTPRPVGSEPPSATPSSPAPASESAAPPSTSRPPAPRTTSRAPAPPRLPASYEAEAAARDGRVEVRSLDRASGGRYVGNVGDDDDNTLRFTVSAPAAGQYTLTIHYINGERYRYAYLRVNDSVGWLRFASTGSWQTVGSASLRITLRAGTNTVEFGNPYSWAPDFDRIVLSQP